MKNEIDIYRLMSDLSVLAVSLPQTALYEVVIERIMQVCGCDYASLYMFDHTSKKMVLGAHTRLPALSLPDEFTRSIIDQPLCKTALKTRMHCQSKIPHTSALHTKSAGILQQHAITHITAIPIFRHQESIGIIIALWKKRPIQDHNTYQVISNLLANALTCSNLFKELQSERRTQGNILYILNDGVITVDTACVVTFWNYASEKITGLHASETVGKDCFNVFMKHITDHQGKPLFHYKKDIHHIIAQDTACKIEGFFKPINAEQPIFLRIRIAPYREKQGVAAGYIFVFENASVQWEVGKLKEDWRSMLTHDLKAPLTAAFGSLQIVSDSKHLAHTDKKLIAIAMQAHQQLLALVNVYLDVQKLNAGVLTINPQVFHLKTLVRQCMHNAHMSAYGKKIQFKCIIGKECTVRADQSLIQRVINNLISNAIKSIVHEGIITIRIAPHDNHRVRISITDTGSGITPEDLPHIFDQFYQTATHRTYLKSAGAGLGLTFCKQVITAHGETITVESKPHTGTTFSFLLCRQ